MSAGGYWSSTITRTSGLTNVDRLNEILFGLIMVLTFTCSISVATDGREEISTILWTALGCNVAWGFIDSLMYLFAVLLERGEQFEAVRTIRNASTEESANEAVKQSLPVFVSQIMRKEHLTHLSQEIKRLPEPPARVFLTWNDLGHALMIFLLVFLATFPVTVPFIFSNKILFAMRVSNAIALLLLFLTGLYLAKQTGRKPILTGLAFALIGSLLVAVTMALGG